jgi:hypothetical protein
VDASKRKFAELQNRWSAPPQLLSAVRLVRRAAVLTAYLTA